MARYIGVLVVGTVWIFLMNINSAQAGMMWFIGWVLVLALVYVVEENWR